MQLEYFLIPFLAIMFFMHCLFILAIAIKNNSIVDIGWGLGFIIASGSVYCMTPTFPILTLLFITILVWGLRLSLYIFMRNHGKGEDFRYKQWREEWGNKVLIRSYFQVFLLQGIIMYLIHLPILLFGSELLKGLIPLNMGFFQWTGLLIWLIGFAFESIADYQLFSFKRDINNKGAILTTGLWKYTRHPNYFGESLVWWGIYLIVCPYGIAAFSIVSPLLMTYLLRKVSGVTLLEKKYTNNSTYQDYIRKTPVFIPFWK